MATAKIQLGMDAPEIAMEEWMEKLKIIWLQR